MSLLKPTVLVNSITDIKSEDLKKLDVNLLLIDVDNTLAHCSSPNPFKGVEDWILKMKELKFDIVIVSNNFEKRVSTFAKLLDLPFVSLALKPMPFGFRKAIKLFGYKTKRAVVIGDQVFTDVLGANLINAKSILLEPMVKDETLGMRIRRYFEKPIRKKIKNNNKIL